MAYLDTSVIVALLTGEPSVGRIRNWLGQTTGQTTARSLMISDWTLTELSSALSTKLRSQQISRTVCDTARIEFRWMLGSIFHHVAIDRRHFHIAASYCTHHHLGLRSGDALHLAIAVEIGAEIITLDKRFAAAVAALGGRSTLL